MAPSAKMVASPCLGMPEVRMIMLRLGSAIGSLAMFVAVVSAAIAQSEDLLIYHRFDGNLKDSSGNGLNSNAPISHRFPCGRITPL